MEWSVVEKARQRPSTKKSPRQFKKHYTIIIAALFFLAVLTFAGYTWASKTVSVIVDGQSTQVRTFASTVGDMLKSQNIVVEEKDNVTPATITLLEEGMEIVVERAYPVVIVVDGKSIEALSANKTVDNILEEYGVELGQDDIVTPVLSSLTEPDMTIKVVRVTKGNETEEVTLPYKTKKQNSSSMLKGQTKVITPGKSGIERRYWEVVYHDNQEVERNLVRKEIVVAPIDKVVVEGTVQTVSRSGQILRFSRSMRLLATGYTYTGNKTASGVAPRVGVAATDNSIIPIGTRLYVEGYGYATALDKGSNVKGNRIDLFFNSREEALNWGKRWVSVYVLSK